MDAVILDLVRETLFKLGAGGLSGLVKVEWNKRFTWKMGDAQYRPTMRIRLSTSLWPLATEAERTETVIHEVCHIVDRHLASVDPSYQRSSSHGFSWRALMSKCGAKGDRCHSVKRPPEMLRKRAVKVEMTCGCRTFRYKPSKAGRYFCKTCKTMIVVKSLTNPTRTALESMVIGMAVAEGSASTDPDSLFRSAGFIEGLTGYKRPRTDQKSSFR